MKEPRIGSKESLEGKGKPRRPAPIPHSFIIPICKRKMKNLSVGDGEEKMGSEENNISETANPDFEAYLIELIGLLFCLFTSRIFIILSCTDVLYLQMIWYPCLGL